MGAIGRGGHGPRGQPLSLSLPMRGEQVETHHVLHGGRRERGGEGEGKREGGRGGSMRAPDRRGRPNKESARGVVCFSVVLQSAAPHLQIKQPPPNHKRVRV